MVSTPIPGQYAAVPFADYLAWNAINNSSLAELRRSPAHYQWALSHPKPSTTAQRNGSWLHCGLLEPLAIADQYVVMPDFAERVRRPNGTEYDNPRGTKAYKGLVAEFERVNAGKEIVTQDQYDALLGLSAAIHRSPAAAYFRHPCETEVSLVWNDATTGLLCKGRLDVMRIVDLMAVDLKTGADASEWEWELWKRKHYRQAAFYRDALYALTGDVYQVMCVVGESVPPFGVRVAPVGAVSLAEGRREYIAYLKTIARCREAGEWPGYASPETWEIPPSKLSPIELTSGGQPITV